MNPYNFNGNSHHFARLNTAKRIVDALGVPDDENRVNRINSLLYLTDWELWKLALKHHVDSTELAGAVEKEKRNERRMT